MFRERWSVALFCVCGVLYGESVVDVSTSSDSGLAVVSGENAWGEQTVLESSRELALWETIFTSNDAQWKYEEGGGWNSGEGRFYRSHKTTPPIIEADDSWSDRLELPSDSLFSVGSQLGGNNLHFVKFTIFTDDLSRVYFQDSETYEFHYEFAVEKLAPFAGYNTEAFNLATLFRENQKGILGGVIYNATLHEYGIQFVGEDEYPIELVSYLYQLVRDSIEHGEYLAHPSAGHGVISNSYRSFYMPTLSQTEAVAAEGDYLEQRGIEVSSMRRWQSVDNCYSSGWAIGRLRFFKSDEIEAAYIAGELLHTDILLTDGVPAELPYVSGVISLSPATPGSHVAILAESYGIPFVYFEAEAEVAAAIELLDTEVILDVRTNCQSHLVGTDGLVDEEIRNYLSELKATPLLSIDAKDPYGKYSENVAILTPDDIVHFGGKAANFGFLLREISENTRPMAVAFSFDLWDDYSAQEIEAGVTLGDRINSILSDYSWPVTDLAALKVDLKKVEDLIEDVADFDEGQRAQILDALSDFDPNRKIRFRSSTNVEDSEAFSGAGLYDSKSGCLADELDGDDEGPSHCDPDKEKERGVFRAMRKVYSSFYNLNAYLERLRFGVDESKVGMAVLAHYSYPDEEEVANGVVRLVRRNNSYTVEVISQPGAVSVTNPELGTLPEVVRVYSSFFTVKMYAELLRLGEGTVLESEDYIELGELVRELADVYDEFHELPTGPDFTLEFEYKKITSGTVEIKQMRRVPKLEQSYSRRVFIGGSIFMEQLPWRARGSGFGTEFAEHYLKGSFEFEFASRILNALGSPEEPYIESMQWKHHSDGELDVFEGRPEDLIGFEYMAGENSAEYRWKVKGEAYTLTHSLGLGGPLLFANETLVTLSVQYEDSRFGGTLCGLVFQEGVYVTVCEEVYGDVFATRYKSNVSLVNPSNKEYRQTRVGGRNGVLLETVFFWPEAPIASGGYTAPLLHWEGTAISGLTAENIVLTSEYAQTYLPAHHNFTEYFVFEPRLDRSVSNSVLAELEALDVVQIYWTTGLEGGTIKYIGFDGQVRDEL